MHLLINNAGSSATTSFSNITLSEFEQIIRTNFFGVVYGCRAFLELLKKHSEGQILNVASCFAWVGCPLKTAYAASKAAIRPFSESLRLELAEVWCGCHTVVSRPGTHDYRSRRLFRFGTTARRENS